MKKNRLNLHLLITLLLSLFVTNIFKAQYQYSTSCFTSFTGTNGFSTGTQPYDIASADFDKDGNLDIVTGNYSGKSISVLMGTGTGSFATAVTYTVPNNVYKIAVLDLNNDGAPDIVGATVNSGIWFVFINAGNGTFPTYTADFTVGGVADLIAADFNSDGLTDLARVDQSAGTIRAFLSTGTGSYVAGPAISTSVAPNGLAAGDFNEDGYTDIVISSISPTEARIFIGDNTGSFLLSSVTSVGSSLYYPVSVVSGDFNSDGHLDASIGLAGGYGNIIYGNGSGTTNSLNLIGNPIDPQGMDVADFDLDGHKDFLAVGDFGSGIQVHIQNGQFLSTMTNLYVGNTTDPRGIVAADFNNDGRPDIATANRSSDNVHVYLSKIPSVSVSTNYTICAGQTVTMSISTAGSYSWNGSSTISNSMVATPTVSTLYSFTGTTTDGCYALVMKYINVINTPTITVNSGSICSGNSFTINPTGAINYSVTGGSFVVNPTGTTSYTVAGTDNSTCGFVGSVVATVTVHTLPVLSVNSGSICTGLSFVITPTGASTYTISGGQSVVSPTVSTDYTVTGKSSVGCPAANTVVASVTVSPNQAPVISVNSGSICIGQSFTLTPSGASTYTFSNGASVVSPTTTTSYSVTGTSTAGCVSATSAVTSITVVPLPTITVNSGTICLGKIFNILPNGAASYIYEGGSQTVSPTSTKSYSVVGTSSAGCNSLPVLSTVTVFALPVVSINSGSLCSGKSLTLTPGGAVSYTITGNTFTVSPTTSTAYSVTGSSSVGCLSSNTAVSQVTVHALPVISVNSGSTCSGKSFTILPSGAQTYTVTGNNFTVTPTTTTSYSVTGSSSVGCLSSNTAVASVTVFASPTVAVNSGSICAGKQFTIVPTGTGAASFAIAGSNTLVSPGTTTNYTVTGTSTAGCLSSNTATSSVTVQQLPVISVNNGSICTGQSFTITPTGANVYSIQGGTNVVTPTSNSTYTITGATSAGCLSSNTATSSVTVYSLPIVSVSGGTVCSGSVFTLVPSGAAIYGYSSGSNTVAPQVTTTYSVWGSSSVGCASSNTAVATVTTVALPLVTIAGPTAVCIGQSATLTAGGALTYLWDNNATTSTIAVNPTVTTAYLVIGADNACSSGKSYLLVVNALPTVSATANKTLVCAGSPVTMKGLGASTYQWSGGAINNVPFNVNANTVFTVTGSSVNNCQNTATIQINVHNLPVITTIPGNTVVCTGNSVALSGAGAVTYTWAGGISNGTAFYPSTTASYTVSGTDANGCTSKGQVTVTVSALPTLSVSTTKTMICTGETVDITAHGASTYTWNTGSQTPMITPTLTTLTSFTVTGADANGCVSQTSYIQFVSQCLGINQHTQQNIEIYPNPNNGIFIIKLDGLEKADLIIYDDAGRIVEHKALTGSEVEVNLPHLANGIYFVRLSSDGQNILNRKLIKQ